jgi:predicted nucleotidyltransferase
MIPLIDQHRSELERLCREFRVRRLDLFGSATTVDFDAATSDIDLIVKFADTAPGYADRYLAFAEALEAIFGRHVDLLTERAIQNPIFRRSVERTRECIYEQRSEQAAA